MASRRLRQGIKKPPDHGGFFILRAYLETESLEQKDRRQPQEDEETAAVGHRRNHDACPHGRVSPQARQRHRDGNAHQRRQQQIERHGCGHDHA